MLFELESLYLGSNFFEGPLPPHVFRLSKLRDLGLSDNRNLFEGSIPIGLGVLTNLRYLDPHSNNLGGYIPSDIGNLKLLVLLDLNSNQLTGPLSKIISNLTNLIFLDVSDNSLSGNIQSDLWIYNDHPTLEFIDLSGNHFTGIVFLYRSFPFVICN